MIIDCYNRPFPLIVVDDEYYLREQSLEDTAAFFEYYADPAVGQYILATIPTNLKQASEEIQYCRNLFYQKRGVYWTLARKSDNKMIGAIGFYMNNHHHRAEICYDLSKHYWRRGIMSRAILKILEYSFKYMDLHRIEALTVSDNEASSGILKKLGFIHEAHLKNYRYFKNQPHDVEIYAITPALLATFLEKQQQALETA